MTAVVRDTCWARAVVLVTGAEYVPTPGLVNAVAAGLRAAYADCCRRIASTLNDPAAFMDGEPNSPFVKMGTQLLEIVRKGIESCATKIDSINEGWPLAGSEPPPQSAPSTPLSSAATGPAARQRPPPTVQGKGRSRSARPSGGRAR